MPNYPFASLWVSVLAGSAIALLYPFKAIAQVTADNSLGNNRSLTNGTSNLVIDGGRPIGSNTWLHSFSEFSITGPVTSVTFSDPGVDSIITRVTGSNSSIIDGLLAVQGDADFFLINPNGVTFLNDARLELNGSFTASTADRVQFESGTFVDALVDSNQIDETLLSIVGDPTGFAYTQTPRSIQMLGADDFATDNTNNPSDITPFSGQGVFFVGGNVTISQSNLTIPGGRVEIVGLSEPGEIPFDKNEAGMFDGFVILADNFQGSNINISDSRLFLTSISQNPGEFFIQGSNVVISSGILESGTISGDANGVFIQADFLSILNNSAISSSTLNGSGNAGEILFFVDDLLIRDSSVFTIINSGAEGIAGNIFIQATGFVELDNAVVSTDIEAGGRSNNQTQFSGGLADAILGRDVEVNGSVIVFADSLRLQNSSVLDANTFGTGNAGGVLVLARYVSIESGSAVRSGVASSAVGNAGGVYMVVLDDLRISGSQTGITTETEGQGDAGLVVVVANGDVVVEGSGSGIFSIVDGDVSGQGGVISINAGRVGVRNGAEISVSHQGTGIAGAIEIEAGLIAVDNGSAISAETRSGQRGDITLIGNFLSLSNSSNVTASADTAATTGQEDASIFLDISDIVFAFPSADSNVTATARLGNGGNISLRSESFLNDIAVRDEDFPESNDITANSLFGESGTISGNTVDINPVRETIELPLDLIDSARLIAQGCAAGNLTAAREIGELTITGRGGLDPTPSEQIGEASLATDIGELPGEPTAIAPHPTPPPPPVTAAAPVIEAQSWQYGPDGEVILTADASSVLPYSPAFTTPTCNDWQTSRS
ncbi:filamentous hemagglutinin N-terminal domain-containing protein [Sphaerothrix gracilis]|uniref:two-partner secretion domain-containing protein n=1 Tax=Sphaerothrix gracilis TaxID=3151835 RepID=UPI0031FD3121